jgi:hypothetical protein
LWDVSGIFDGIFFLICLGFYLPFFFCFSRKEKEREREKVGTFSTLEKDTQAHQTLRFFPRTRPKKNHHQEHQQQQQK